MDTISNGNHSNPEAVEDGGKVEGNLSQEQEDIIEIPEGAMPATRRCSNPLEGMKTIEILVLYTGGTIGMRNVADGGQCK